MQTEPVASSSTVFRWCPRTAPTARPRPFSADGANHALRSNKKIERTLIWFNASRDRGMLDDITAMALHCIWCKYDAVIISKQQHVFCSRSPTRVTTVCKCLLRKRTSSEGTGGREIWSICPICATAWSADGKTAGLQCGWKHPMRSIWWFYKISKNFKISRARKLPNIAKGSACLEGFTSQRRALFHTSLSGKQLDQTKAPNSRLDKPNQRATHFWIDLNKLTRATQPFNLLISTAFAMDKGFGAQWWILAEVLSSKNRV